jgi:predicted secreted protein
MVDQAFAGRTLQLRWGTVPGVAIAGVREKGIAFAGEAIDISADEDAGWRKLLEIPGQNQIDITVSGVTKNDALKVDFMTGNRTKTMTITYPSGGVLTGEFFLANYTDTGTYNDATTFEATFQSTGTPTWAPPTS